jgi:hypothetical protein
MAISGIFFRPDGGGTSNRAPVPSLLRPVTTGVPASLRPTTTTRIPTTTAGEANRFRNIQQASTTVRPSAQAPNPYASQAPDYLRVIAEQTAAAGPRREITTTETPAGAPAPVQITPEPSSVPSVTEAETLVPAPNNQPAPEPEPIPYNVYDDPFYQQALAGAQSQFNLDRIDALASQQYQQLPIQRQLEQRPEQAEAARRRLAGNFAARGMAGGRAGVLTRAEAQANAREISARTGLREQIAELGRQFTSQFGAEGTDWLGTRRGMEAQQSALQQALQNRLAGLTTVG